MCNYVDYNRFINFVVYIYSCLFLMPYMLEFFLQNIETKMSERNSMVTQDHQ